MEENKFPQWYAAAEDFIVEAWFENAGWKEGWLKYWETTVRSYP